MSAGALPPKRLNLFERYLTVWAALCMVAGVLLGKLVPGIVGALRGWSLGAAARSTYRSPLTLFVNWLIKPFSMALLGRVFFKHIVPSSPRANC